MKAETLRLKPAQVLQVLHNEASLHPLARPVDYYKLLLQSVLGPGHIITDISAASSNIISELGSICQSNPPFVQDIDTGCGFIRLDLGYLLATSEPASPTLEHRCMNLAAAMSRSAASVSGSIAMQDLWQLYLPLIKEMVSADASEWNEVASMAALSAIPSHSLIYKNAYHPHYRVLLLSEFNKGLLK